MYTFRYNGWGFRKLKKGVLTNRFLLIKTSFMKG
jgi:hypothetical protein